MRPGPQTIVLIPTLLNTPASVPKLTAPVEFEFKKCKDLLTISFFKSVGKILGKYRSNF